MSVAGETKKPVAWWKEPTKDQWSAWWGAWLGRVLDGFDFTVLLLIMVPISQEFHVPLTRVAFVFSITLWLRAVGGVASGWLADRIGRKRILIASILCYSLANLVAGLSPVFLILAVSRAFLGLGTGAEWVAGTTLVAETWPARTRGLAVGLLEGSWGIGSLLSIAAYGLLLDTIGWRGLLWMGILPALAATFVRGYVKEPEIWTENRRRQRNENREVRAPLFRIFERELIGTTLSACWCMASGFVAFDSISRLIAAHPRKDIGLLASWAAAPVPVAIVIAIGTVLVSGAWGIVSDKFGRRAVMIVPALLRILVAPFYLFGTDLLWVAAGFAVVSVCGNGIQGQMLTYLAERFPTEVRATAIAVCFTQADAWQGFVPLVLTWVPTHTEIGSAIPMIAGAIVGAVSLALALALGPETKGKVLVPDLVIA
jgi:MFS transporter, SHS family, lactate transporter